MSNVVLSMDATDAAAAGCDGADADADAVEPTRRESEEQSFGVLLPRCLSFVRGKEQIDDATISHFALLETSDRIESILSYKELQSRCAGHTVFAKRTKRQLPRRLAIAHWYDIKCGIIECEEVQQCEQCRAVYRLRRSAALQLPTCSVLSLAAPIVRQKALLCSLHPLFIGRCLRWRR